MSDGFTIEVEDAWSQRLERAEAALRADLLTVSQALAAALLSRARAEASGVLLRERSGAYLASLSSRVTTRDDGVTAEVSSNSPVAVILEYGATIGAHDILPSTALALRFEGGAGEVFAEVVHFPGARIAPRPVLHMALDATATDIAEGMSAVRRTFVESLS